MAFEVVDAERRLAERRGAARMATPAPTEQRTGQPGPSRVGDDVDRVERHPGARETCARQRQRRAGCGRARPAPARRRRSLAACRPGCAAPGRAAPASPCSSARDERHAGFVAGGFDAENAHAAKSRRPRRRSRTGCSGRPRETLAPGLPRAGHASADPAPRARRCSTITRPAEAIVSGRWATITRVMVELADRRVHLALALDVEGARRLVEEQELRPLVERTRQQDALALAAGRCSCPCRRSACASPSASPRSRRRSRRCGRTARPTAMSASASKKVMLSTIEPAKQLVFLHHRCRSCRARRAARAAAASTPPIRISPACGAWMPSMHFSRVVLPQPDGPTIATESPGSMRSAQPAQHRLLRRPNRRSATSTQLRGVGVSVGRARRHVDHAARARPARCRPGARPAAAAS